MSNTYQNKAENKRRRKYGVHLTSTETFHEYIFPYIKNKIKDYLWIDLYAGEGNLVLPLLKQINKKDRINYFLNHIYLSDIQDEMIQNCINKAEKYGIPSNIARRNIVRRDNLLDFPTLLLEKKYPIFHVTNPPYLYLGYIRKNPDTQKYLKYFENNKGFQDLYQIAMMNDLRKGINNLIYIIPSNFLFGASVSNKFRMIFLQSYKILKMIICENKIFEHTGTNICIGFFKRKKVPKIEDLSFSGIKIKQGGRIIKKDYTLKPKYKFRAGFEFDEFLNEFRVSNPLVFKYYLKLSEFMKHHGKNIIDVIDANKYEDNDYKRVKLNVDDTLKEKITSNILYLKTVDTGSTSGRVGLARISSDFGVMGIYVSGNTYRTHPIQIFFEPQISIPDQNLLKIYFNFILESFREKLDSEFLTTYKYSNADYTRKFLGLTQARKIIETFPYEYLTLEIRSKLKDLIMEMNFNELTAFLADL